MALPAAPTNITFSSNSNSGVKATIGQVVPGGTVATTDSIIYRADNAVWDDTIGAFIDPNLSNLTRIY